MAKEKSLSNGSASKKTAAEIAEAAMPGWKSVPKELELASDSAHAVPTPPDATLPSLADLKRKYLGEQLKADPAPEESASLDDTEVVTLSAGSQHKKVGVKDGKIIWHQG
jgi:hypothetical protein